MHEHFAACCFLFGVCNMLCCLKQVINDGVELLEHYGIVSSAAAFLYQDLSFEFNLGVE
jgi:hypothetical protein